MSQLQVNRINDASGGVLAPISSVMRNRIINGAMVIDQRNAGASVTPTGAQYLTDRWQLIPSQASKLSFQQNAGSVTPPVGFTNYLGATSLSAYSLVTSDYFLLTQKIEGFNSADLGWGTANAKTITVSFWVRSSLTGTFGFVLRNNAGDRVYPASYTISSANTWEQKSVTIAGDTSGTWLTNNLIGVELDFGLGVASNLSLTAGAWTTGGLGVTGATSVVGTNGATFYITGVQLEVGTQATSFEYRQYTTELQLCQRYFCNNLTGVGVVNSGTTNLASISVTFPVTMRVTPTFLVTSPLVVTDSTANYAQSSANSGTYIGNPQGGLLNALSNFTGLTSLRTIYTNSGSTSPITASAEL